MDNPNNNEAQIVFHVHLSNLGNELADLLKTSYFLANKRLASNFKHVLVLIIDELKQNQYEQCLRNIETLRTYMFSIDSRLADIQNVLQQFLKVSEACTNAPENTDDQF